MCAYALSEQNDNDYCDNNCQTEIKFVGVERVHQCRADTAGTDNTDDSAVPNVDVPPVDS